MKKGEHIARGILCPFYLKEDQYGIHCEGIGGKSIVKLVYQSPETKKHHRKRYCCRDYKRCPIGIMLYRKYGEDV